MERELVTIVCADVAGYSRLVGMDEEGTVARLKAHRRSLIDPKIAEHGGRIVKTMGDGLLIEFRSPVEAVRCAVEIQQGMAARDAAVPEGHRMALRIGINLGDVIIDANDVLGDGVNIAARLETLSDVGGICVSRAVRDQVRDRLPVRFEDMGEQCVRNIARPIRCYRIHFDDYQVAASPVLPARRSWFAWPAVALGAVFVGVGFWVAKGGGTSKPEQAPIAIAAAPIPQTASTSVRQPIPRLSIIVLPFRNLSGDHAQDYFAEGLTDDVTTDLSRIPDSFVISRNTAATFNDKPADPKQVAKDLGIRYVLEGSARRVGNRIRVNAQLIDGETGGHLWAERFERDVADINSFQDDVTGNVARALSVELVDAESRRSRLARPNDPDAVDLAMQGWALLNQEPPDKQRWEEARRLFKSALDKDGKLVRALCGLALAYAMDADNGRLVDPDEAIQRADEAAQKAISLDPKAGAAHRAKGFVLAYRFQLPEAIAAAETAISLDRNDTRSYNLLARLELQSGHPERSRALAEEVLRLSPRDYHIWVPLLMLGRALIALGENEAAVDKLQKSIAANPGSGLPRTLLAAAYGRMGRKTEARAAIDEFLRVTPDLMTGQPEEGKTAFRVQVALAERGYYIGLVDGRIGPFSQRAITTFQREQGLAQTGAIDAETLQKLGVVTQAQ